MQYTYNTILASCQNYCIDNSIEFINEFDNILQLSAMRILKDLDLSQFSVTATGALTPGSQLLTKPDDYIAIGDLYIFVNEERTYMQLRDKSWLYDYWRSTSATGQPAYYCEDSPTQWLVAPTPNSAFSYQINYTARPLAMTADNPNTWIGDKLGELLLYATLMGSMMFFREDVATEQGITQAWERLYQMGKEQARSELAPLISGQDNKLSPLIGKRG